MDSQRLCVLEANNSSRLVLRQKGAAPLVGWTDLVGSTVQDPTYRFVSWSMFHALTKRKD